MLGWCFSRRTNNANAHNLYGSIVTITRNPELYNALKVPDTLEMRFELLMFHMFVFLNRLNASSQDTGKLRQELVNCFFADMETTSRQVGVGDLAIPKKMRRLATQYATRMDEYSNSVESRTSGKSVELYRNIFYPDKIDPAADAKKFYAYSKRLARRLEQLELSAILKKSPNLTTLLKAASS